mmetsp:Transcript_391/g.336  ORF Transcript_391/g.336 Transcript_391/m.336 type:complete len:80 (-) Transcript_391:22-261(-)
MEAAVEGECILANTYSKEVVGKETLVQLLRKNDQAKDAELAPLTARCHGKVAELSWNGPTKMLILQLRLLKIFGSETNA